jgi:hypothetical protein
MQLGMAAADLPQGPRINTIRVHHPLNEVR